MGEDEGEDEGGGDGEGDREGELKTNTTTPTGHTEFAAWSLEDNCSFPICSSKSVFCADSYWACTCCSLADSLSA